MCCLVLTGLILPLSVKLVCFLERSVGIKFEKGLPDINQVVGGANPEKAMLHSKVQEEKERFVQEENFRLSF